MIILLLMARRGHMVQARAIMRRVLHMLLADGSLVRVMFALLHRDRNGQRVAAEQRQPDGKQYGDQFSVWTKHVRSL